MSISNIYTIDYIDALLVYISIILCIDNSINWPNNKSAIIPKVNASDKLWAHHTIARILLNEIDFYHWFFWRIALCHSNEASAPLVLVLLRIRTMATNLLWHYKLKVCLKNYINLLSKNSTSTFWNSISDVFNPTVVHFCNFLVIPFLFFTEPNSTGIDFLVHSPTRN